MKEVRPKEYLILVLQSGGAAVGKLIQTSPLLQESLGDKRGLGRVKHCVMQKDIVVNASEY